MMLRRFLVSAQAYAFNLKAVVGKLLKMFMDSRRRIGSD
jgi:hypothetical protein